MKLTETEKSAILAIVNNPQLSFAETKSELARNLLWANEKQIETLAQVICQEINQAKRGKFTEIFNLEGKKIKTHGASSEELLTKKKKKNSDSH